MWVVRVVNLYVILGLVGVVAGTVQLFFRETLIRSSDRAAARLGLPPGIVARSWPMFVVVRCLPLWLIGAGFVVFGLLHG